MEVLIKNKTVLIDDDVWDVLKQLTWYISKEGYVTTGIWGFGEKTKLFKMEQFVIERPKGMVIDHINRNRLDNRKENLRIITHQQNNFNRSKRLGCSSKYKGVTWVKNANSWKANIKFNDKNYYLGYFKNEEDAGKAYDKKALELFGEFAYLNFPVLREEG